MCPDCGCVYDESDYAHCPDCYEDDSEKSDVIVFDRELGEAIVVPWDEAEKYNE